MLTDINAAELMPAALAEKGQRLVAFFESLGSKAPAALKDELLTLGDGPLLPQSVIIIQMAYFKEDRSELIFRHDDISAAVLACFLCVNVFTQCTYRKTPAFST
jgi:hypothetical protein